RRRPTGSDGRCPDVARPAWRVRRRRDAGLGGPDRWIPADRVLCQWPARGAWGGGMATRVRGGLNARHPPTVGAASAAVLKPVRAPSIRSRLKPLLQYAWVSCRWAPPGRRGTGGPEGVVEGTRGG